MTTPRTLMLVSAWADRALRAEVQAGRRPCPEYRYLEENYGVEVLDWSRLNGATRRRSARQSIRHALVALRRARDFDVIFSDGEHVAIPLAIAMRVTGISQPHLVIGHHLSTRAKRPFFRILRAHRGMTRILLHSRRQLEAATAELGIPQARLAFLPYFADDTFWRPRDDGEESLIVTAGREHRDYLTLARACAGLDARVFIAQGSLHSPRSVFLEPEVLPTSFQVGYVDPATLRDWYGRASLVVVPLIPNDFQAGVTTLLEAMAMGKATVVSATAGQRDVVEDGITGILVSPGDAGELRRAIQYLLARPGERMRLGRNARLAVERTFGLQHYGRRLAEHLAEVGRGAAPVEAANPASHSWR
jgi:glycosyltransferase involved in cell wall biosynthesis